MKHDTEKTLVKFVIFKGELIALFPKIPENNGRILSYQRIGQHGPADKSLLRCKKATPEQYNPLKKELESIGYNLEIKPSYTHKLTQILHPVNSSRGAPMGRSDIGQLNPRKKVITKTVKLYSDYDKGGAYWGFTLGNPLLVQYHNDLSYVRFIRKMDLIVENVKALA